MDRIPQYPGLDDMKKYNEWLEILKQRLRDKGQKVNDDPLDLQKNRWPRPLPYIWPTDRPGVVI